MVLSTFSPEGKPHGRYVLLKGLEADGFVFFTNYQSEKGRDLAVNPQAALTFGWIEQERQVRIEGSITKTPREAVEAYFPNASPGQPARRLGLAAKRRDCQPGNPGRAAGRGRGPFSRWTFRPPPEWGRVSSHARGGSNSGRGRTNRLHDRFRYRKEGARWIIERLAP